MKFFCLQLKTNQTLTFSSSVRLINQLISYQKEMLSNTTLQKNTSQKDFKNKKIK